MRKNLRILHILPFYHPVIGGMEALVKNITENLVKRGHEVDIFTARRTHNKNIAEALSKKENINGVNVSRFKSLFDFGFISFFPGFIPILFKRKYDVIHLHSYRHLHTDIGSWIGSIKLTPVILHGHGPFYSKEISKIKFSIYSLYDLFAKYTVFKNIDKLIAFSEIEKQEFIKRGCEARKIKVIPNGIPEEVFESVETTEFISKYGLSNRNIVLYAGRIHPIKRIDVLIRALSKLCIADKNILLLLIGPNAGYYENLLKMARDLGVENNLKWLGVLDEKEKIMAYNTCHCLVLPSDYEPFGLVLAEAMACGKPVIAVNAGGPSEIVTSGLDGFLINRGDYNQLADRVLSLLTNTELARQMGQRAKQKAEKYRLNHMVTSIEALYYELNSPRINGTI